MSLETLNFSGQANNSKKINTALATAGALTTAVTVPTITQLPVGVLSCESMSKISGNLSKDTVEIVNKGAQKVLDELTDLSKKGVEIIDGAPATKSSEAVTSGITSFGAKIKNSILDLVNPIRGIQNGKNACFAPNINKVVYHKEKMSLAAFHEIGHAHNFNSSKFWKAMQKLRMPAMYIPLAIGAFVACTKNSKPEAGKELTGLQKAKNFIRNHGAGLAFVASLPIIAEEVAASVKGCKWANKVLDKNLAKKVLKTNAFGAISYLAIGVCSALGVHLAKKIKDNAVAKQEAKSVIV